MPVTSRDFRPEHGTVRDVLGSGVPFIIPRYQRGYDWDERQVTALVRDVRGLLTRPEKDTHFFGTVITVLKQTSQENPGMIREVVDGQQRLTTFTLALIAMRGAFQRMAVESHTAKNQDMETFCRQQGDDIDSKLLQYKSQVFGQPAKTLPLLRLSRQDHSFYAHLVRQAEGTPSVERPSHDKLLAALETLQTELVEESIGKGGLEKRAKALFGLANALRDRCTIVLFTAESWRDGTRLFSVLNDRGKPLNVADLLRTRTLEIVDSGSGPVDEAEADWAEIQTRKSEKIAEFLRNNFAAISGERAPKEGFFGKLVEQLIPSDGGDAAKDAEVVAKVVRVLRDRAKVFWRLLAGKWPFPEPKASTWDQDRLARLVVQLKHRQSLPLLLAAATNLDEVRFTELVRWLELCVFRYVVSGGHNSRLGDTLIEHAGRISTEGEAYELKALLEDVQRLLHLYSPDAVFQTRLRARLKYEGGGGKRLVRHFLTTLEQFKDSGAGVWTLPKCDSTAVFDLKELEIEHVYPQRPSHRIPELDHFVHTLGNLSFWGPEDNNEATNSAFVTKKPYYAKSKVGLNRAIAQVSDWNRKELEKRELLLAAKALEIWRVPGGNEPPPDKESQLEVWIVRISEEAGPYNVPGRRFELPTRGRAAKRIAEGGVIICFSRDRDPESARVVGLGVVGRLVPRDADDEYRIVDFAKFTGVAGEPPVSKFHPDWGRTTAGVVETDFEALKSVLQHIGLSSLDDLETAEPLPPVEYPDADGLTDGEEEDED